MTQPRPRRLRGLVRWPTTFPDRIKYGYSITSSLKKNDKVFPAPVPTLDVLNAALDTLSTLETEALTKAAGTANARDAQWITVEGLFDQELGYIQTIADGAGNLAKSQQVFDQAGVSTYKNGEKPKRVFHLEHAAAGEVEAIGPAAGDNTAHMFEWGIGKPTDPTQIVYCIRPRTTITGLAIGAVASVRMKVVTLDGHGEWSEWRSILVTM